jgi:hypothetical protein
MKKYVPSLEVKEIKEMIENKHQWICWNLISIVSLPNN